MSAPRKRPSWDENPQNDLTRAIDLERDLTEEDYATNSDALKKCQLAWAKVRAGRR